MTRYLFLGALVLTLSATFLAYQNSATAQESAGSPSVETVESSQSDAPGSQQDTSSSSPTEGGSQPASGGTPNSTGNESSPVKSEPASQSDGTTSPRTSPVTANEKGTIRSPNEARKVPSPQRPVVGDTDQTIQRDEVTPNRDRARDSAQGEAKLNGRPGEQKSHYDFRRGIQFGQATNRGLAVSVVEQDGIYYRSGFRRGDVIISLYGRPVRNHADFMRFIVMHPGQRVPVIVLRDGRRQTIYVEYPREVVHTHIYDNRGGTAYLGVLFDSRVRDAAIVVNVSPGSPAETAGMRRGDMILAMNGQEIHSYPEVISMIRSMRPGQEVDIVIRRGQSDTQVFAVLGAQANVRTATRPSEIHAEHHSVPVDQTPAVQIELNHRGNNGRFLERDRYSDGNPDQTLLPRLRD